MWDISYAKKLLQFTAESPFKLGLSPWLGTIGNRAVPPDMNVDYIDNTYDYVT